MHARELILAGGSALAYLLRLLLCCGMIHAGNIIYRVRKRVAATGAWESQAERATSIVADRRNLIWVMPAQGAWDATGATRRALEVSSAFCIGGAFMNALSLTTPVTIAVEGVSKVFPQRGKPPLAVLDSISLQARSGAFVSVVGPSGSGKSTLLSIIAGLEEPSAGSITLEGDPDATHLGQIGYMPQRDLLLPWRNALDNALAGIQVQGIPKREARKRAHDLFCQFGLAEFESSYPHELSGGMRQRVAFARTVLAARNLMLLDEPFGALDAFTRLQMQRWLLDIWGQLGKTAILVTHDPEEALLLADRVYVFSARPARVILTLDVALPRPRPTEIVGTPDFARLKARLLRALLTGQDFPQEPLQQRAQAQEVNQEAPL